MGKRKERETPPAAALYGFSEETLQHGWSPQNMRKMENAHGYGKVTGSCGDTIECWVRIGDGREIEDASFLTDGCTSTQACGSMTTSMAKGMSVEQAFEIRPEEIIHRLEGIPEEHCAALSVGALHRALGDCMKNRGGGYSS